MTYTEWLEKEILKTDPVEIICETISSSEYCRKNCKPGQSTPNEQCLRHKFVLERKKENERLQEHREACSRE